MSGGFPLYFPVDRTLTNRWNSSEHLYQASKYSPSVECISEESGSTITFIQKRIRNQASPRGAKMTQKCGEKRGVIRYEWDEIKVDVMTWVIELKLHANYHSEFGRSLMSSKGKDIVEVSKKDDFWGTKEVSPGVLIGHNHLGRVLTNVRNRASEIIKGNFSFPEGFLLTD